MPYILDRGSSYGSSLSAASTASDDHDASRKHVIVEFSSPNIGREFDGAHLRSTIIGASIAALYEGMGWHVHRTNFLGDWGKHIGLLAVGWYKYGSDELFEADPLRHLLDVFSRIDDLRKVEQAAVLENDPDGEAEGGGEVNGGQSISDQQDDFLKRMEDGDSDAVALWRRFRDVCIAEYPKLYAKLGIKFDGYSGESEVSQSTLAEVEAVLKEKGIYEYQEGAWVIDFKKHGSKGLPKITARHSNGTTSYLLRDLATVIQRKKKFDFGKMVYVVSAKQDTHFHEVFKTLELMGDEYCELAKTLQHVNFGKVQGLSPRTGSKGLLLGDLLEQCQKAMSEALQSDTDDDFRRTCRSNDDETHNDVNEFARLALMSQELSITKRTSTHIFNLGSDEKVVPSLESYAGLKIQRWLDRLRCEVEGESTGQRTLEDETLDYSIFEQEEAYADVLKLLAQFPNVVKHAFEKLEPSMVLTYLLQVVEMLSIVWDGDGDANAASAEIEAHDEVKEAANQHDDEGEGSALHDETSHSQNPLVGLLYECARIVLENGMNLIGMVPIKEPDRRATVIHTSLPQDADGEPVLATVSQEVHEEADPTPVAQSINEEASATTMPQEHNEQPGLSAVLGESMEVNNAESHKATMQDFDEQTIPAAIPEETDMKARLPEDGQSFQEDQTRQEMPEQMNNLPELPAAPQDGSEQAVCTGMPQDGNETIALASQEVYEDQNAVSMPEKLEEHAASSFILQDTCDDVSPESKSQDLVEEEREAASGPSAHVKIDSSGDSQEVNE